MKKYGVVILTDPRYVNANKTNTYIQNAYLEDNLLKKSLQEEGINAARKSWDDPNFDWSSSQFIIFRSTWDYFDRFEEFSMWLNKVSLQTTLLNSEKIIRWNIDKHYLQDLQKKGVHICESHFIEKGDTVTLRNLSEKHSLETFVLKPCISGAGRHTYKISQKNITEHETIFAELIANEAMIVQPFQHNIVEKGEVSMMVMNGKFTHAVLKIAKPGDFRVQDDFGGTVHHYTPTEEEIAYAEHAVKSCPEMPIYARVDVFLDNQNKLALAELELIEPELWFRNYPKAAEELAIGIKERIKQNEEIS